jgi:hypothetical protein
MKVRTCSALIVAVCIRVVEMSEESFAFSRTIVLLRQLPTALASGPFD